MPGHTLPPIPVSIFEEAEEEERKKKIKTLSRIVVARPEPVPDIPESEIRRMSVDDKQRTISEQLAAIRKSPQESKGIIGGVLRFLDRWQGMTETTLGYVGGLEQSLIPGEQPLEVNIKRALARRGLSEDFTSYTPISKPYWDAIREGWLETDFPRFVKGSAEIIGDPTNLLPFSLLTKGIKFGVKPVIMAARSLNRSFEVGAEGANAAARAFRPVAGGADVDTFIAGPGKFVILSKEAGRIASTPSVGAQASSADFMAATIFRTGLATGMRSGELRQIRLPDIDLVNKTIKTEGHVYNINPDAIDQLSEYINTVRPKLVKAKSSFLWPGIASEGSMGEATFRKIVAERTPLPMRPHDFRRTFATRMLEGGASLPEIQRALGHVDELNTLHYLYFSRIRGLPDIHHLPLSDVPEGLAKKYQDLEAVVKEKWGEKLPTKVPRTTKGKLLIADHKVLMEFRETAGEVLFKALAKIDSPTAGIIKKLAITDPGAAKVAEELFTVQAGYRVMAAYRGAIAMRRADLLRLSKAFERQPGNMEIREAVKESKTMIRELKDAGDELLHATERAHNKAIRSFDASTIDPNSFLVGLRQDLKVFSEIGGTEAKLKELYGRMMAARAAAIWKGKAANLAFMAHMKEPAIKLETIKQGNILSNAKDFDVDKGFAAADRWVVVEQPVLEADGHVDRILVAKIGKHNKVGEPFDIFSGEEDAWRQVGQGFDVPKATEPKKPGRPPKPPIEPPPPPEPPSLSGPEKAAWDEGHDLIGFSLFKQLQDQVLHSDILTRATSMPYIGSAVRNLVGAFSRASIANPMSRAMVALLHGRQVAIVRADSLVATLKPDLANFTIKRVGRDKITGVYKDIPFGAAGLIENIGVKSLAPDVVAWAEKHHIAGLYKEEAMRIASKVLETKPELLDKYYTLTQAQKMAIIKYQGTVRGIVDLLRKHNITVKDVVGVAEDDIAVYIPHLTERMVREAKGGRGLKQLLGDKKFFDKERMYAHIIEGWYQGNDYDSNPLHVLRVLAIAAQEKIYERDFGKVINALGVDFKTFSNPKAAFGALTKVWQGGEIDDAAKEAVVKQFGQLGQDVINKVAVDEASILQAGNRIIAEYQTAVGLRSAAKSIAPGLKIDRVLSPQQLKLLSDFSSEISGGGTAFIDKILSITRPTAAILQVLKAGLDFGFPNIHGFPIATSGVHTPKWARAAKLTAQSLLDPEVFTAFRRTYRLHFEESAAAGILYNTAEIVSDLQRSGMVQTIRHIPGIRQLYDKAAYGMNVFLDILRVSLWMAMKDAIPSKPFARAAPGQLDELSFYRRELAGVIMRHTGGINPVTMGVPLRMHQALGSFVFFAPLYRLASYMLLVDVFKGGVRGREALQRLSALSMAGLAWGGAARLMGNEDAFDPTTPRFMAMRMPGTDVYAGFGTAYYTMARLAGGIYDAVTTQPEERVDIPNSQALGQAIMKVVRSQASAPTGIAWDILVGNTFVGNPLRGDDGDWLPIPIMARAAGSVVPFWAFSAIEEMQRHPSARGMAGGLSSGAFEFFGLRTFPVSIYQLLNERRVFYASTDSTDQDLIVWRNKMKIQGQDITAFSIPILLRDRIDAKYEDITKLKQQVSMLRLASADNHVKNMELMMAEFAANRKSIDQDLAVAAKQFDSGLIGAKAFREEVTTLSRILANRQKATSENPRYIQAKEFLKSLKVNKEKFLGDILFDEYMTFLSGPDVHDVNGIFLIDKVREFEADFKRRYGLELWDYIQQRRVAKTVRPASVVELEKAKIVLQDYWNLHNSIWGEESNEAQLIKAFYRQQGRVAQEQFKQANPELFILFRILERKRAILRHKRPDIDWLLVKWYEYAPSTSFAREQLGA